MQRKLCNTPCLPCPGWVKQLRLPLWNIINGIRETQTISWSFQYSCRTMAMDGPLKHKEITVLKKPQEQYILSRDHNAHHFLTPVFTTSFSSSLILYHHTIDSIWEKPRHSSDDKTFLLIEWELSTSHLISPTYRTGELLDRSKLVCYMKTTPLYTLSVVGGY